MTTNTSSSKKPSLSLFVSPSSPPIPSTSTLPPLPSLPSNPISTLEAEDSRNYLSTTTSNYTGNNNNNSNLNDQNRITSWGSAVSSSSSSSSSSLHEEASSANQSHFNDPSRVSSSGGGGRKVWEGFGTSTNSNSNSMMMSTGEEGFYGTSTPSSTSSSFYSGFDGFKSTRGNSIFQEFRESSSSSPFNPLGGGRSQNGSFSTEGGGRSRTTSIASDEFPTTSLVRLPSLTSNSSSSISRTPSTRSKTLSFFDNDSSVSGVAGGSGDSPTPPPNPLSRNSSLNTSIRPSRGTARGGGLNESTNWMERTDDPDGRPPVFSRKQSDSPVHSPTLTTSGHFLPNLPNVPSLPYLPPQLIPFSTTTTAKRGGDLSLTTSITPSSPSLNSATSNNSSNNSHTTPNLMSTLPSGIEPPSGYSNRFNSSSSSSSYPNGSESQISTPTLATFSQLNQTHHHQSSSNSPSSSSPKRFTHQRGNDSFSLPNPISTLNPSWMELDSPPLPSSSSSSNPMPSFSSMQQTLPPPSSSTPSNSTTSTFFLPPSTEEEERDPLPNDLIGHWKVIQLLGKGAFSRVVLARGKLKRLESQGESDPLGKEGEGEEGGEREREVALKLILRKSYDGNERMRISVVREVEVLKHIHHPSLTTLLSSFSTPIYTVLVLDYSSGGELFDFLAEHHSQLNEAFKRRIFGELCDAVGWMHEIGLVHRDIKLENILLTSRPFDDPTTNPITSILDTLPAPFIKLTDFGLSRFIPLPPPSSTPPLLSLSTSTSTSTSQSSSNIQPTHPSQLLTTRCGSESYAAPELILGKKYDGRKTDSWALGVVLFAIGSGEMPFVEADDSVESGTGTGEGGEGGGRERGRKKGKGRKAFLIRIAKGEYSWPNEDEETGERSNRITKELKSLVSKFLTRDPNRRLVVNQVWEQDWFVKKRDDLSGKVLEWNEGTPVRVKGWVGGRT